MKIIVLSYIAILHIRENKFKYKTGCLSHAQSSLIQSFVRHHTKIYRCNIICIYKIHTCTSLLIICVGSLSPYGPNKNEYFSSYIHNILKIYVCVFYFYFYCDNKCLFLLHKYIFKNIYINI